MDAAAVADELSPAAARTLVEAVRCLALEHPDNDKFGFIKWYADHDGNVVIVGPDWNGPGPSEGQVNELAHTGCAILVEERAFQPTGLGRRVAAEVENRATAASSPAPVDLSWSALQAVMRPVYDAWVAAGAPPHGVMLHGLADLPEPRQAGAALAQLEDLEWVRCAGSMGSPLPSRATPLTDGIAAMENWPTTPEAAQASLLSAIQAAIPSASKEDQGRLREIGDNVAQLTAGTAWSLLMAQFGFNG